MYNKLMPRLIRQQVEKQDSMVCIDNSNPDYSGTLYKIEELKDLIQELEKRFSGQVPQGITNELAFAQKDFLDWIEEIEFTLGEFCTNTRT